MNKKIIEVSFFIWALMLFLSFVVVVFQLFMPLDIPTNLAAALNLIITVVEVAGLVIGVIGIFIN